MFVDRDGKYQLGMFVHLSLQAPCSVNGSPAQGRIISPRHRVKRQDVIKAGVVPLDMLQRYFNKWSQQLMTCLEPIPHPVLIGHMYGA